MRFLTKFTITELNNGWEWLDIEGIKDGKYFSEEMALRLFCEEELEIPQQFLKEITLYEEQMQIQLCRDRSYIREDWYVNLSRISG
ncbi:MAG: hypothetical protein IBX43_08040 [Campylobacterales bacterium]|nr:hypothetical protein [Campylobacterales bacterium]